MRTTALLAALALAALLLACGGSDKDAAGGETSDGQLAAMTLALEELGPAYDAFELDDDSGFRSNEEAAEEANDKEDERSDIERFGRINGFETIYISTPAFMSGKGPWMVSAVVDLFQDAEGASGSLWDDVDDWKREVGRTVGQVTLSDAQEFDPGDIGDETTGVVATVTLTGNEASPFRMTAVAFRRGPLVGTVGIARFDEEDVSGEVIALAQKLDERIQSALGGEMRTP